MQAKFYKRIRQAQTLASRGVPISPEVITQSIQSQVDLLYETGAFTGTPDELSATMHGMMSNYPLVPWTPDEVRWSAPS